MGRWAADPAGGRGGRAVGPAEGPAAAVHLAQAADGVEDDGGTLDGQAGNIQVGLHLAF